VTLATSLVGVVDSSLVVLVIQLTTCGDDSCSMAFANSLAITTNSSPMVLTTSMVTLIGSSLETVMLGYALITILLIGCFGLLLPL